MVLGPLCGKSQVGETKYSGLVLAMVPECLEVWSFKTGACWVDVLPDVAVAMLGRSACSWRITANQQQQELSTNQPDFRVSSTQFHSFN
jgi:hypothetical protein